MNEALNKSLPRTTIFIHSIAFHGDTSSLSTYKVEYHIQSEKFLSNEELGLNKILYFKDSNSYVSEENFPQNINFILVFKNEKCEIKLKALDIIIENYQFNVIKSFPITFNELNIDVTVFIRTKINNKIKLDGFPLINPSLDKCRRINNNVFSLNDDLVLKEIKSKKLNRPSDESMREILPFYDMEPNDCIIKLKGYAYIFDNLYLVLEKGDESLEEHIRKRDLNNEMIMKIIVCVCCGLIHMHKHNYIHRDIKPANIVVSKNGEAKLIDFGIVAIL